MSPKAVLYAKAVFAVSVWGGSFIATKIAIQDAAPFTVIWLRFLMGMGILLAAVAHRRQFVLPARRELAYFALLGFIGITFHQWLQTTGLQTAQATTTAWIVATTPIFMALLGWLFLRERLSPLQSAGIFLAALGVLIVVSKGSLFALADGRAGTVGDLLILIGAPNWAVFSVLSRHGLQHHPAGRMMLYVMGFGWLFSTLLFLTGPGFSDILRLTPSSWLAVAFLGVFASGFAYIAWYDALQVLPSARLGAFLYLEPLVAVVIAALLLAEPLAWASLIGGTIILIGVWLVNRPRPAPSPAKEETHPA